jgi:hypothetical protein
MPATQQLAWFEISKFGGLWTNGGRVLMPADAAQVMSGCLPQKSGGLRAFYQPVPELDAQGIYGEDTNPFSSSRRTQVRGFGLVPDAADIRGNLYFVVTSTSNGFYNSWKRASAVSATYPGLYPSWSLGNTSGMIGRDPERPYMVTFVRYGVGTGLDGGEGKVFVSYGWHPGDVAQPALNSISAQTPTVIAGVTVNVTNTDIGPITRHQGRLVVAQERGIIATDPGQEDLSPSPIQITPGEDGSPSATNSFPAVAWLLSIPPSDLLVGLFEGTVYNIQGDLSDPTIREVGRWGPTMPQQPVNTPHGAIIIFPHLGPTILGADGSTANLGEPLDPSYWRARVRGDSPHFGSMAFAGTYLFAPNLADYPLDSDYAGDYTPTTRNNGLLVYDFSTGSWFNSVHPDVLECVNPRFVESSGGRYAPGIFTVNGASFPQNPDPSFTLISRYPIGADGYAWDPAFGGPKPLETTRAWRWEWKSAPLREPSGRLVHVQEIQVAVSGFSEGDESSMIVTVTNEVGETESVGIHVPMDKSIHNIPIRLIGEYVEVTVLSSSIDQTTEAPMLDSIRIGYVAGHRKQPQTVVGGYEGAYPGGY